MAVFQQQLPVLIKKPAAVGFIAFTQVSPQQLFLEVTIHVRDLHQAKGEVTVLQTKEGQQPQPDRQLPDADDRQGLISIGGLGVHEPIVENLQQAVAKAARPEMYEGQTVGANRHRPRP